MALGPSCRNRGNLVVGKLFVLNVYCPGCDMITTGHTHLQEDAREGHWQDVVAHRQDFWQRFVSLVAF
jgi:hypothetical protein